MNTHRSQPASNYQCGACEHFFSDAVDACPLCGDQLYWLVRGEPSAGERERFVKTMHNVVEQQCPPEFITYGDRLWLPYNYWASDSEGVALQAFDWVEGLTLFQHESPAESPSPDPSASPENAFERFEANPTPWETVPGLTRTLIEKDTAKVEGAGDRLRERMAHEPDSGARDPGRASKRPRARSAPDSGFDLLGALRNNALQIGLTLFFFLLGLSVFVLRYHHNTRLPDLADDAIELAPIVTPSGSASEDPDNE
jgi:hypothetical protein